MAPNPNHRHNKHVVHFTKAAPLDPNAKPGDVVLRLHTKGQPITDMQNAILAIDPHAQIGGTLSLKAKEGHLNKADGFFNLRTKKWLNAHGYDASKGLTSATLKRLQDAAKAAHAPAPVASAAPSSAAPIVVNEAGIPTLPGNTRPPAGMQGQERHAVHKGRDGNINFREDVRIQGPTTVETDSVSITAKPNGTGKARSLQDLRLLTATPGTVADVRTRTDRTVTTNGARATTDERLLDNKGHRLGESVAVENTQGGQSDLKVYKRSRSFLFFHHRTLMSDTTLTPGSTIPALAGTKASAPAGINTAAYGNLRSDASQRAAASDLRAEVASNLGNQAGYTVQSTKDIVKPAKKPSSPVHGI